MTDDRSDAPVGGPPEVREFRAEDAGRWNEFVLAHPEGTFFHLAQWKIVLERAFRHTTHYLVAETDGQVRGILPLARIRSLLFGDSLISTPFCVYGGILAGDDEARARLEDAASRLAERLRVGQLVLRNRTRTFPEWPCNELYVTFRKELNPDPEENLKAIPRKQRAMVRKGIRAGLTGELDDGVDRLYEIYTASVRNLGTPVFHKNYLRVLREEFGDACEVLSVCGNGKILGSVMSFYFRDEVLPYYGGGTTEARAVAGNDFMYWELMRRAAERGVRVFDFGRSKRDVGSYRFKKHWGFEPEPLYYEHRLVRSKAMPDLSPLNPKYRMFIETWKRLPVPVAKLLGPPLARNLG